MCSVSSVRSIAATSGRHRKQAPHRRVLTCPPSPAIVGGVTRDEYLRIPYVLVVESVMRPDGDWLRRASYPELPGACAEAESAVDAMDLADDRRVSIITERLARGELVPVPRPPI